MVIASLPVFGATTVPPGHTNVPPAHVSVRSAVLSCCTRIIISPYVPDGGPPDTVIVTAPVAASKSTTGACAVPYVTVTALAETVSAAEVIE